MSLDYLKTLRDSLEGSLDFDEVLPLHGPTENPWSIGVVEGIYNKNGRTHSEIEMVCFMWGLTLMLKPQLVIETGTNIGVLTKALGLAVQANGFGKVLSAEIDKTFVEFARKRCEGLPVTIHHGPALDLKIEDADLLFVDSSYESRKVEMGRAKPGAVVVVHDTTREEDVRNETRKYARRIEVVTPRGFTIIQK